VIIGSLELLKDKYLGEPLFIVGNGSSLLYDQLDAIKGHYSWAMNNITLAYPHTDWRPDFYSNVTMVAARLEHHKKCAEIGVAEAEYAFVWSRNAHLIFDNPHELKGTAYLLSCYNLPIWSNLADREVSRYGNSIFTVFQLATYLGFRQFFLLGCDMKYEPWDADKGTYNPAHFCPNYSLGKYWDDERMALDMMRGFQIHDIAAIYIGVLGGTIWNCASDSLIEAHPKIGLESALELARKTSGL